MMQRITFFCEDIEFVLEEESRIATWLVNIADSEGYAIEEMNYIFCSDEYLLNMNREFLQHDYYTDIITFDNSNERKTIMGDIFISVDRVKENAADLHLDFKLEMYRVIIHGLLHLLGFNDKSEDDQTLMRKKEDTCLSLLK